MIKAIKYKDEVFPYPVYDFLYPYLLKFAWRKQLKTDGENVLIITDEVKGDLVSLLQEITKDLLDEFYKKPSQKDISDFPGRYEQVEIDGEQYVLNITTNLKDRISYQTVCIINWLKKKHPDIIRMVA